MWGARVCNLDVISTFKEYVVPQLPIHVSIPAKRVAFALVIGALAATPLVDLHAQKVKPPTHWSATVTLANRLGDGLTSVGASEYPGAEIGVSAGDLRLELGTIGRAMQVTLGAPLTVGTGVTDAPNGVTYVTDAVLFIGNVGKIPVGTTQTSVGRIGLGSAYPNHAVGFRDTTVQGIRIYGTDVCVTRTSISTWNVASSCDVEPSDEAGLFQENLKGKINHHFKASYAVPFAFTVTCANCTQ